MKLFKRKVKSESINYNNAIFSVNNEAENARNAIMLNAHFIEKEMVIETISPHLMTFLNVIATNTCLLIDKYPTFDEYAILLGTKILLYFDQNDSLNVLQKIPEYYKKNCISINVGTAKLNHSNKNVNEYISFIKTRHSYRNFANELIPETTIKRIIELSSLSPSACNRQPCKIVYSTNHEGNEIIRKYVVDKYVSKNIMNFFAVIVDRSYFNKGEECQNLINAGIFINQILLAIHAVGLGATAFQTPISLSYNKQMQKDLKMTPNEMLVATIGYGKIKSDAKIAVAHKKPTSFISRKI